MSLTKQQLLDKAKPRFEIVDVEGWGPVGIRTCPQIQSARRSVTYNDPTTGAPDLEGLAHSGIHRLIDQLMTDEETPMFTDDDFDELSVLNVGVLTPLYNAIDAFDGGESKKP